MGIVWFHQISGETVGEVRIVADMHERKAAMAQEAEAFIALPGEKNVFYTEFVQVFIKFKVLIFVFRRLWNNGGTAGDDNMVTTWYP